MRKFLFLVLIVLLLAIVLVPACPNREIRQETLIRRAFLDVTGMVPTINEIEWYCIYNNNGYELAIEDLINKSNKISNISKNILLSLEYKNKPFQPVDVKPSILYVAGKIKKFTTNITNEDLAESKKIIVKNALKEQLSEGDTIDLLCNQFMSRTSTVEEENYLVILLKEIKKKKQTEEETFLELLEHILQFPNVTNK